MRIGLFSDTFPPFTDGVSTSVLMLKRGLEKIGHDVFVVTVNPESFKYKEEDNVLRIPGIKTGIYQYRLTGLYPIKAQAIIKSWKLDVIHTHTEFGIGTFARIVARKLNIPVVHTYHTMYEEYMHYITKG
ncbi:MAG TPA: glycosyltransferase, partial [Bacilli bacterium]|nr:glycosyltransferase [Bacilli bacterium]